MGQVMLKYLGAVAVLVVGVVAGCDQKQSAGPAPAQMPPPEVGVTTITPRPVVLTTELPGRTSSYRVAEIRPQINGLIQKRLFVEGTEVKAGDVLYEIDPAPYKAAYDSAVANLASVKKAAERAKAALFASEANIAQRKATVKLAEINRKRFEELYADNAVSASERDRAVTDLEVAQAALRAAEAQLESDRAAIAAAEAAIEQAQAAVDSARINLEYTRITAPISGRIGRSSVTEGAIVTAYQPVALATIQALDPIYVDVPQSTNELLRLRRRLEEGRLDKNGTNRVRIMLPDGSEHPHVGELKFRDVSVDPSTGSVMLRIVVPNPDGTLLPGMFVRAIIEEGSIPDAILAPQQAVSRDPRGNASVMVVDAEGKVAVRPLVTERAMGDQWLISSGLSPGDRVIVEGLQRVRPGVAVKVVTLSQSQDAAAQPVSTQPVTHAN